MIVCEVCGKEIPPHHCTKNVCQECCSAGKCPYRNSCRAFTTQRVFERFADEMFRKYLKRVNKPGNTPEPWKDFPEIELVKRLYDEIDELTEALEGASPEKIADELLDVANFCMFLWTKLQIAGKNSAGSQA